MHEGQVDLLVGCNEAASWLTLLLVMFVQSSFLMQCLAMQSQSHRDAPHCQVLPFQHPAGVWAAGATSEVALSGAPFAPFDATQAAPVRALIVYLCLHTVSELMSVWQTQNAYNLRSMLKVTKSQSHKVKVTYCVVPGIQKADMGCSRAPLQCEALDRRRALEDGSL